MENVENDGIFTKILMLLLHIFYLPVGIIGSIFGDDPDTVRFYIGVLLIAGYGIVFSAIATFVVIWTFLSSWDMLFTILFEWLP